MNVSIEEQALAVAQWQSFVQNAESLTAENPNPKQAPRREEPNPELAESWFGRDSRGERPITSRPPPALERSTNRRSTSQPPIGDPLADSWFRE